MYSITNVSYNFVFFQSALLVVLMVTLIINVMFILDTSKKLQADPQEVDTGETAIQLSTTHTFTIGFNQYY